MELIKKYNLQPRQILFVWISCLILISGGLIGLSTPSGSLFLRTIVSADFDVQAWRYSVKKNTHEFYADHMDSRKFHTNSSIQHIYLGVPRDVSSGNVKIEYEKGKVATYSVDEIKKWPVVKLPMGEIKLARPLEKMDEYTGNYVYHQAPQSAGNPSILTKLVPGMNWSLSFGLIDVFKMLIYSMAIAAFILWFQVKSQIPLSIRYLEYIIPAFGFIYCIWMIFYFGVDMFWMDALAFPDLLKAKDQGAVGWGTLWAQHNEHRLVLVRILFLILAMFKPFNMLFLSVMNQALIFGSVFYFISKVEHLRKSEKLAVSLITTFLFFSPAHVENTILPFHGQWHGTVCGMLLVAGAASNNKFFMKSIVFWAGFLIAYASMPPWVCIPMAILGVLALRQFGKDQEKVSKKELIHFFAFGVITLLFFAYYMKGWNRVSVSPIDGIYKHPFKFILFFIQMVGNQVQEPKLAYVAGFIILSLATYLFVLRQKGKIQIPNTLVCLFMLSASWCFITSIGRSTTGTPILPRYVFISSGIWAATLSAFWLNRKKLFPILTPVIVLGAVGLISLQSLLGYSHGGRLRRIIERDAELVTKAVQNQDSIYLKHSEIIPVFNLKEDQGKRDMVLGYFLYMQKQGYWSPVSK